MLLYYRTLLDSGQRYFQSPPRPDVFAMSPRSSQHPPDVDQVKFGVREPHIRRALRRMRDTCAQGLVHHPGVGVEDPGSRDRLRSRMAGMLGNVTKDVNGKDYKDTTVLTTAERSTYVEWKAELSFCNRVHKARFTHS